jgi:hypothetical protein
MRHQNLFLSSNGNTLYTHKKDGQGLICINLFLCMVHKLITAIWSWKFLCHVLWSQVVTLWTWVTQDDTSLTSPLRLLFSESLTHSPRSPHTLRIRSRHTEKVQQLIAGVILTFSHSIRRDFSGQCTATWLWRVWLLWSVRYAIRSNEFHYFFPS